MCGINLSEESARLSSADIVGTQTRSIGDQSLLPMDPVRRRVSAAGTYNKQEWFYIGRFFQISFFP